MPIVNIMVNARGYAIACDDGEEDHLRELATCVDGKVKRLLESVGQVGDAKLILMAALLIADDYFDAASRLAERSKELDELTAAGEQANEMVSYDETGAAAALRAAAQRIEDIAARLSEF
jgi:cell division protein ZapA